MEDRIHRILLQSVELNTTDYLSYGSIVQLTPCDKGGSRKSLSITPSAFKGTLESSSDILNEHGAVTLTTSKYPCRRNTFALVHPDDYPRNHHEPRRIHFNEDFLLQSCCPRNESPDSAPLVIYSSSRILENPSMDVDNYYRFFYTNGNLQQPIALTERPKAQGDPRHMSPVASVSCRWRFVHPDPEYRYEYEGEPVPASQPVLILHTATNKFLTPDWDRQRLTLLGQETCVSVRYRPARSPDKLGLWLVGTPTPPPT